MKLLTLEERLGLVSYRNQAKKNIKPHIVVNTDICNSECPHKATTYTCPANCYTTDDEGKVHFQVDDCIECGTCMYACDQGAVTWSFPDPETGRGVNWNYG
ncbi:MAG: 4Fe-4S binding protein [Balneolaceae bacterium]